MCVKQLYRYFQGFIIPVFVAFCFLTGCNRSLSGKRDGRINISPARHGAPSYSDMNLITEDATSQKVKFEISEHDLETLSADKIILKAWAALGKGAIDVAIKVAEKTIERFTEEAKKQQKTLAGHFPKVGTEDNYKELNAVGTAYYIIAEAYEKMGKCKKALEYYHKAIQEFPLSQNWDPRGWFWKVAEEARAKIEKISEVGCEKK